MSVYLSLPSGGADTRRVRWFRVAKQGFIGALIWTVARVIFGRTRKTSGTRRKRMTNALPR